MFLSYRLLHTSFRLEAGSVGQGWLAWLVHPAGQAELHDLLHRHMPRALLGRPPAAGRLTFSRSFAPRTSIRTGTRSCRAVADGSGA